MLNASIKDSWRDWKDRKQSFWRSENQQTSFTFAKSDKSTAVNLSEIKKLITEKKARRKWRHSYNTVDTRNFYENGFFAVSLHRDLYKC